MFFSSDYNKIDKDQWSKFVLSHTFGSIFNTPEMYLVYQKTKYYKPVIVFAYDADNSITGVLIGVIQKEMNGIVGVFSSRCIIWGGPLVKNNDPEITKGILVLLNKLVQGRCIYTQFRNIYDNSSLKKIFEGTGYKYEPHLDILINIGQSFDKLKQSIHKSRIRNFTKSYKKGAYLKEIEDFADIEKGYNLLKETYKRLKIPLPDKSLFVNIGQVLGPAIYCKFLALYLYDVMIGFRLVLTYKDNIYDFYAASSNEHSNNYPNDVLILEILKFGCQEKYNVFDFGGAGKPDIEYSVRDYKLQFGGDIVSYGRFTRINNSFLYVISFSTFKILQFSKGVFKDVFLSNPLKLKINS